MSRRKKPTRQKTRKRNHKHLVLSKFGIHLAKHHHSGKHLPGQYTSYTILFFLLVFTACVLLFAGNAAKAVDITGQGTVSLTGFSKGPPPQNPAVITNPKDGDRFRKYFTRVSGVCEKGLFIELYRNDSFAGGVICQPDGTFSILVTLVPGQNELYTRIHDALGQYGPNSPKVTVYYDVLEPLEPLLLVHTVPIHKGVRLGQHFNLVYSVHGGILPYAVSIDWGDGSVADVLVLKRSGKTDYNHKYSDPGQYTITIGVTDERGHKALIQTTVVVHGVEQITGTTARCSTGTSADVTVACSIPKGFTETIDRFWPALVVAGLMTLSFWAGEKIVYANMSEKLKAKRRRTRHSHA